MSYTIRDAGNADTDVIRKIVYCVLDEYGLKPDPQTTDSDLDDIEKHYLKNGGTFKVVEDAAGEVIGCGGLLKLNNSEMELRKMYFLPVARGQGMGKALLEMLINYAKQQQIASVSLETATPLKEAIGLYKKYGFTLIATTSLAERCDQAWELKLV